MFNKLLLIAVTCCPFTGVVSDASQAQAVPHEVESQTASAIADARRAVEAAQLRLRLYERVEYPRQQRRLDAEITLTATEVDKYRKLLAEYKQISSRTIPDPLILTRQTTELALLAAELKLKDLREENRLLWQYHTDQCRLFELEVDAARSQLLRLLEN